MNFGAVDLNLLRVFDAMMLELNTMRAGERVGLSQPAVSSALGRLRHIVGDDLFVRDGNRMVPTARALQLKEPVRAALRQMEDALTAIAGFDPAVSEQAFVVTGSDFFSTLLMPRLAGQVVPEAPGVIVQMLDRPSGDLFPMLSDGTCDLAVDRDREPPEWIGRQMLFQSYILCVAAKGHPVLAQHKVRPGTRIPPEVFSAVPHVLLSMDGGRTGTVDGTLKAHGLSRRVAVTVPHFQAVALTAAASPLIGSLPVHFARHAAALLPLDLYLPPYDPPKAGICLYWHKRLDRDPANIWLRAHVARALDLDRHIPAPPVGRTDATDWSV
jgi:DNA-binding transcriptional LysR family regulator